MALRSNLAAGFAGSACIALAGLAFIPVYIRYLGSDGWGAVGFFITLQGWLSIVDNGLSPSLNREFARVRAGARSEVDIADLLRSAEWLYSALGIAGVLVMAACSHWFATSWLRAGSIPAGSVQVALQWLGVAIAVQWLASLYRQSLLGLQRQVMPHMTAAVAAIARGLVTWLAFEWVAPTLPVFVAAQVAMALAEMLVLRMYLHRSLPVLARGRFARGKLGELRGFAAGLTGISLLAILLTQGDKLLLSALLPLEQFGFVMLAVTVSGCIGLAASPMFMLAYPRLSESAPGDQAAFSDEYARWSQWLAVLVLPVTALIAWFASDLLALWTRDTALAHAVAPLLSLWVLGSGLNAVMHIPYAAQLAHGWTRLALALNALAVVVLVPATLWFVSRHGAIAGGWIWVGINAFYVVIGVQLMHRRIMRGEAGAWYVHALVLPGVAALGITAAAAAWRAGHDLSGLMLLALFASTLLASFGAAVLVTPHPRSFAMSLLNGAR